MRKSEREITEFNEITDVLDRCDTIRLGLNGEYPYVVPLSFGYEISDSGVIIYVHGAKKGKKHDMIKDCGRVCVEADIFKGYAETKTGITAEYESIIGFGKIEKAEGDEAFKGLDLLLEHCGYKGYAYSKRAAAATLVYKIILESITGKRRIV